MVERISKMPQQDNDTSELDHGEEVDGVVFVADDKAPEVLEPGVETFDLPAPSVPAQGPAVLREAPVSVGAMRGDQLDAAIVEESLVQSIAVVGLVADEAVGEVVGPHPIERVFDEGHFVRRSAGHVDGERKTTAVCNSHDLRPLAPLGLSDREPPFFALAKEPSMKASERSMPPRSWRSCARAARTSLKTPARVHCWKRRWQVWYEGYRSGKSFHGAPVRRIQRIPSSTSRGSRGGLPRHPGRHLGFGISGSIRFHCSLVRSMHCESAVADPHSNDF